MVSGIASPFQASTNASTVTLAASTTAATANLPGTGESVLILNTTGAIAFVRVGGANTTATQSDLPVAPGGTVLLNCGPLASVAAAILSTGSGNVMFTRGSGSFH